MPLAHTPRKDQGSNIPSLLKKSELQGVYYLLLHLSYIYVNYRSYTEDIFKFSPWVCLDFKSSVLYHIPLMFRRSLDLIKFSFHLQSVSLLCHFSACVFAAIEVEGKKARLRRTYRHHPIHYAAQFGSAIHGPFLTAVCQSSMTGMLHPHLHEVHLFFLSQALKRQREVMKMWIFFCSSPSLRFYSTSCQFSATKKPSFLPVKSTIT